MLARAQRFIFNLLLLTGETLPASFKTACGSSTLWDFKLLESKLVVSDAWSRAAASVRRPSRYQLPCLSVCPSAAPRSACFWAGELPRGGGGAERLHQVLVAGRRPRNPYQTSRRMNINEGAAQTGHRATASLSLSFIFIQAKIQHINFIQTTQLEQ